MSGWSLGETRALSVKAARGAGLPWGLAEEAGHAVSWLESRHAPGAAALAALLLRRDGREDAGRDCPLAFGTALADMQGRPAPEPRWLAVPLLAAPFLAAVAGGGGWRLEWPGAAATVSREALRAEGARAALLTARAECRAVEADCPAPIPRRDRVPDAEAGAIAALEGFAARLYAPASERSRRTGAGAGLVDTD